ncbi:MAG: exopolyphosphatase / guanosine-5-triphosphate,3-diphosphate pyrophosphatase [Solirubrobacteraceae bacterium]|nr:exopolyphosphatase / guanosine-5-triphosphate,3-diphosphate pyrophosphatase [Solirubrobacteraceae bacterium]
MRVAVVDIGTNSTRLLVAEVGDDGRVDELERRTTVTRLGQGVDASGRLADEAMGRVFATLAEYRAAIDAHGAEPTVAVLTSAVRDAANGPEFTARVRDEYGLDARTIPGEEEARLTFLGATSERSDGDRGPSVVIDIGGGSTEYVVGENGDVLFHVSTQAGVVRQSERHLHTDPPTAGELRALAREVRSIIEAEVPEDVRARARAAIAVAGTATQLAAIDQKLEPYDASRVHGYRLTRRRIGELLDELAALPLEQRREVPGLDPARAPTIVAGAAMLGQSLDAFGLDSTEISEHDILRGAALEAVHRAR